MSGLPGALWKDHGVLTVLAAIGVLLVIFVAAVVATREGHGLVDAPADAADVALPDGPLQPEDVHAVRFAVTVRGYRMSEVDEVLERVARELADRDERIALLVAAADAPAPAAPVVPAEPPLDAPPGTLQSAAAPTEPEPPSVEVATVPVELAPLPERSGDEEPAARD